MQLQIPIISLHILGIIITKSLNYISLKCFIINFIISFIQLSSFNKGYILTYTKEKYQKNVCKDIYFSLISSGMVNTSIYDFVPQKRLHYLYPKSKLDPAPLYYHYFIKNNNYDIIRNINNQIQYHSKVLTFQNKYYRIISVTSDFILPMYICFYFSGNFIASFMSNIIRIIFNWHFQNLL